MRSFWLALGLVVACGGGDDERHPAAPEQGGTPSQGGSSSTSGSSSKPDAGQAGETEQPGGGGPGEGGAAGEPPIIYEMGGKPQTTPGVCDPLMELGEPEPVDVGAPGATLLAMTGDELSVAFTTGADETFALHVADRASLAADFTALAVSVPEGYQAAKGVALSADGRNLIIVREDSSGLAELSRTARGMAFGVEPDETRFAAINALEPMSGFSVGWPVLSGDGKALYFVSYFGYSGVKQSRLDAGGFSAGKDIDPFTLGGEPDEHKLLSGLADDQRAIFFFDEATSHAGALFRSYPDAPFYEPLDLGERQGVTPNKACTRVYSSVGSGIVVQSTN